MISAIFNAVKQRLEDVLQASGDELPQHDLGAWKLPEFGAPNRIVWEVMGGPVSAPRQTGQGPQAASIRQIATRNEQVLVHVWGRDFESAEKLLNHFVAAARAVCTSYSFEVHSTDWTVGQEKVTNGGRLCILTISVRIPFTAEPIGVSHAPHTATVTPTVEQPS